MPDIFAKTEPVARKAYEAVLKASKKFGPLKIEGKKTCIHLVAGSAFAGIHPRKQGIVLNIRTARPIKSSRIRKSEQLSANRYHNEMVIDSAAAVDAEVVTWLREAYALGVG
jgi:hypothetical protein